MDAFWFREYFPYFPAVICQRLIEQGEMDTGIVCCEGYDDEIITKCFRPYDNLTIAVTLNPDGKLEKRSWLPCPTA